MTTTTNETKTENYPSSIDNVIDPRITFERNKKKKKKWLRLIFFHIHGDEETIANV